MDIITIVTSILQGKDDSLNYPYVSWKNVHDGAGGSYPGLSLSSILQTPASEWSTDAWGVFWVKWNEWFYVLQALMFFGVFGTTPEMRQYYRSAFWFIPEQLGYKRRRVFQVETVSDVAFNSNPGQRAENGPPAKRRRNLLSFLETTIDMRATHSEEIVESSDLESGVTTTGPHYTVRTATFVDGNEGAGGI